MYLTLPLAHESLVISQNLKNKDLGYLLITKFETNMFYNVNVTILCYLSSGKI